MFVLFHTWMLPCKYLSSSDGSCPSRLGSRIPCSRSRRHRGLFGVFGQAGRATGNFSHVGGCTPCLPCLWIASALGNQNTRGCHAQSLCDSEAALQKRRVCRFQVFFFQASQRFAKKTTFRFQDSETLEALQLKRLWSSEHVRLRCNEVAIVLLTEYLGPRYLCIFMEIWGLI